tara:strand:+ start:1232 stop:1954 length:723 start_codon:yes stop_codon:yes gene_type:complete
MALIKALPWQAIIIWLVCITVVTTCLGLSYWQFSRAKEKQLQLDEFSQSELTSFEFIQALHNQSIEGMHGQTVSLMGRLEQKYTWFLDNKIVNGQVGVDVISLFKVAGLEKNLLVNLGFIPIQGRGQPEIISFDEIQNLNLVIKSRHLEHFTLAKSALEVHSKRLQFIDHLYLSNLTGEDIYPAIFYQLPDSAVIAEPHYQPVVMSPEKHHAYALQWFLIAMAAAFIAFKATRAEVPNEV